MEGNSTEMPKETVVKERSSARVIWLALIVVACVAGFFVWRNMRSTQAAPVGQNGGGPGGRPGGAGAVPVVVAAAQRQDLPVYLEGLGSVTAFNTDTIKSRVDGQLVEVNFAEGQDVKKGDELVVIDPRPYQAALDQAQANLARDQFQLKDAKLNQDRYDQLVKQGVIPQQQADTQRALVGQLQGAVDADQAQIDTAKLNLTYSHITSPIDGRIGLRLVDIGNIVHATDPGGLIVITQMEPIAVIFTLPEDGLPAVVGGMRAGAALPVLAFSRDNGTQIATGKLLTIDNQIDPTTGTYKLKAIFENKDRALWPNQFVNARLLLNVERNATIVPAAAIQRGSAGTFVYRVKPDKTVEAQPVMISINQGNVTSIKAGIKPGDEVVTEGQDRLRAGMAVDPHFADEQATAIPGAPETGTPAASAIPSATQTGIAGAASDPKPHSRPGFGQKPPSQGGQGPTPTAQGFQDGQGRAGQSAGAQ
jgi:membrane fusion protein, multidrug efflux system